MFDQSMPYDGLELPPQDELDRLMDRCRAQLFLHKGAAFLATMLAHHEVVWSRLNKTAWCDGKRIGFNPEFFYWLSPKERVTVLAHEIWHTGFLHFQRMANRDPKIWNQAGDHVINLMLEAQGFVFGDRLNELGLCKDSKFTDWTTEEVYQNIFNEPPKGGGGSGPDQGGPLDGDIIPMDPSDKEAMAKAAAAVSKAIQAAKMSKDAGSLPGEISLVLDEFLNPKLPWNVLLQRYFTELTNDEYSYRRPNRRYEDYRPSLMGDTGLQHLIYYLDISGSVSDDDVLRFNSEVRHIHNRYQPKRLTLVTFDTQIQDVYEFTDDMPFEKIVVHGRGGTCLKPVRAHIEKHKPDCAVIFSDLFVEPMKNKPRSPILWIVVGNDGAEVPFGTKIHIDSEYMGLRVPGPG